MNLGPGHRLVLPPIDAVRGVGPVLIQGEALWNRLLESEERRRGQGTSFGRRVRARIARLFRAPDRFPLTALKPLLAGQPV